MSLVTSCVNGVCTCVLPLPTNDFRPLALRHRSLAFVSALLVAVKVVTLLGLAITPTTAELSTITVERVVQLTNAERQKAGQSPLKVNPRLTAAAHKKGEDMLAHDYFAHISPTGVTPWFWMQQQGYTYQIAGENLAIDFTAVEDVVAAWIASPSHRDNMLHDAYTETGVAVVTGEFEGGTSTVVVHMFGLPTGVPAAPETPKATPLPAKSPTTAGTQTTPTPTPTPVPTVAPDTTPPRSPRIAFVDGTGSVVTRSVPISIESEVGTAITVVVNDSTIATLDADNRVVTLDVSSFPDGDLRIAAVARDGAGNTSEASSPLHVRKDATAPSLAASAVSFLLSPQTDIPEALAAVTTSEATEIRLQETIGWRSVSAADPLVLSVHGGPTALAVVDEAGNSSDPVTFALVPAYTIEANSNTLAAPRYLNRMSRWLVAAVFVIVVILLMLAIFIRISIQRPILIAHASAVMLLAAILFVL